MYHNAQLASVVHFCGTSKGFPCRTRFGTTDRLCPTAKQAQITRRTANRPMLTSD